MNLDLRTNSAPDFIQNEAQFQDWLDQFEKQLERVSFAHNNASFNKYAGRPSGDLDQYDEAFSALLNDPASHATVRAWQDRVSDPRLARRVRLFNRAFLEAEVSKSANVYQLRNTLNEQLINFKPRLGTEYISRSDVSETLRVHPDRDRRRLVYQKALSPLALELAPGVARLMQQRNQAARRLGFPTYPDLHLYLLDLDRATLLAWFAELEKVSRAPYQAFVESARQEYGLAQVEPWDIHWLADRRADLPDQAFRREKIVPGVHRLLAHFGLSGPDLPIEVVTRDIPFGGLCFTVRVPDDIRILCNPKDGYPYFRTMTHEFGHALHGVFNRQPSYILKREWGPFNEGMAETLAYFTHYGEWLAEITGLTLEQIAVYKKENNNRRLLRLRNLLAQAHFEIEAYDNPAADLHRLLAEHEARYLLIPLDLTPRWSAASFPTTHPVYRQNYILADMIAAQTHATLRAQFGDFFGLSDPQKAEVMEFLKKYYYGPGASIEWREKVRQATGQPLGVAALLTELGLT